MRKTNVACAKKWADCALHQLLKGYIPAIVYDKMRKTTNGILLPKLF